MWLRRRVHHARVDPIRDETGSALQSDLVLRLRLVVVLQVPEGDVAVVRQTEHHLQTDLVRLDRVA